MDTTATDQDLRTRLEALAEQHADCVTDGPPHECPYPGCGRAFETVLGLGNHYGRFAHPDERSYHFWYCVDVGEPDECWEWAAATHKSGYGVFSIGGEQRRSHRLAYILVHGEPENWILHSCDNRPCCNPAHLYDGTPQDNVDDRTERSGWEPPGSGEDHPTSKLTDPDVAEMRERYAAGDVTYPELAEEYCVHRNHVGEIVRGEGWPDAPGPITEHGVAGEDHPHSKLTEDEVVELRERYATEDVTLSELAEEYGLSGSSHISQIVNGEIWPEAPGPIKGEDY